MFLRVDADNADFWNDENATNILGPLNLQDELEDNTFCVNFW